MDINANGTSIPAVHSHFGSSKILMKFNFYIKLHLKKSKTSLTEVNDHHSIEIHLMNIGNKSDHRTLHVSSIQWKRMFWLVKRMSQLWEEQPDDKLNTLCPHNLETANRSFIPVVEVSSMTWQVYHAIKYRVHSLSKTMHLPVHSSNRFPAFLITVHIDLHNYILFLTVCRNVSEPYIVLGTGTSQNTFKLWITL